MKNQFIMTKKSRRMGLFVKGNLKQNILFGFVFVLFALYALTMIASFLILIMSSLESAFQYEYKLGMGLPFSFPKKLVFDNYVFAFSKLEHRGTSFWGLVVNSLWYTAIATACPLFANACVAYAVSKYNFKLKNVYYGVIIFAMTIPIMGTAGAFMQLIADLKLFNKGPLLNIVTSFVPGGMSFLVLYAFFKNISWEYAEAVLVDGGGHFVIFFKIMLPMAIPAVGALALVNGISAWNSYLDVLLYNPDWPTLASGLYGVSQTLPRLGNTPAYYAALVISIIPILTVFIAFSDKVMSNFTVGGLKG